MCDSKPIPHKHAAVIKAWADGAIIEVKTAEGNWAVTGYPSWRPTKEFRIKPEPNDLEKYGTKAGDIWLVNGERLLFTYVVKGVGVDCISLSDGTNGAFGWNWDKLMGGALLFRANEVNKL